MSEENLCHKSQFSEQMNCMKTQSLYPDRRSCGYDGTKLRKSVDKIKEANDKHNQEMENMAETGQDQ
jgi:hypothetical protein